MKPTRLALAIATAAMVSQPVLATNGDHLIGLGAQSRAMGGTGAAAFFGSENALTNPALIGKMQGTEFVIGGTVFMPSVKAKTDVASMPGQSVSQTSDADLSVIPEVSLATRINDNWVFGLGIFGTAGMGVDYRDNGGAPDGTGLFNGYSNLQLMKFAPTLAYNDSNWGIGFAPVIQYGALDINYKQFIPNDPADPSAGGDLLNIGNGMSQDYGFGFNVGGYFDVTPELTLGLAYQSAINMKYKDQITTAAEGFMLPDFGVNLGDELEQPSEIKVGAAYTMGNMMYTADYKRIGWGSAKGYKDFNWEDQDVFAIGAKYTANKYWLGVGYNYGSDPIKKKSGNDYASQAINLLNNHFFPAVVESHFTFGGGYSFTENLTVEGAVTYAAEKTKTVDTGLISGGTPGDTSHKVTHSQLGYTLALRMNF
ncbi:aromatic hydrocarbon degradation protein [Thiomicrospira aerophila AL3]|uniref:Aromatic hydrocarbon degradation protein n=1 Tax=Thiomicrospira aerophila AL3 TaxID=717772 RepID=W0DTV3_9GAMM|nr:outer membrane protein transport protein [Thiomicrospira aerophila]AHF01877.1 aromatic hydrocarbon degradation protein [Thiomicrospira aerophila AL3]